MANDEQQLEVDSKHEPDTLWSMGLFSGNPDQQNARDMARQSADTALFRFFMILTFGVCVIVCRYCLV